MKPPVSADLDAALPRPYVLCTLVKVTGSAPQEPGARMSVGAEAFVGTLGGGELERLVIEAARELLKDPRAKPVLKEVVLCKETGQCCGGRVEVFLQPLRAGRTLFLFGGGHVGRAAAEVLAGTPLDVVVVDPRPDWLTGLPASVRSAVSDPLEFARGRSWGPAEAAVVWTFSHDLDFALIKHLLPLPLGYLGLIGSEHKAKVFLARLMDGEPDGGWDKLWEERMHCPVGLPLRSKNPKVIAVAAAAELLSEWGLAGEDT
ncbi:MAG: xanthine dehydrogenase accessory factor [Elusimicrobia bacterium]|nr:MAG: xanthine dehydrogenase accessory factor [Elusimicrobiota bacterium]